MTLRHAKKILSKNDIIWYNFNQLEKYRGYNNEIDKAILRIRMLIFSGKK